MGTIYLAPTSSLEPPGLSAGFLLGMWPWDNGLEFQFFLVDSSQRLSQLSFHIQNSLDAWELPSGSQVLSTSRERSPHKMLRNKTCLMQD